MTDIYEDLQWRGLVALTTDEKALRAALNQGPVTVYCGFDPTAPSLHFGNLVQLVMLRHLQRAGHRVLVLVGGSTGQIGDPKPTSERTLKTKEQTAANVARIKTLVRPFLQFEGDNAAVLVDNLDWTAPLSALDFLRDIGKHFRVNQMLRKDAVAARLESQEGISYTEFSYQLLQGYDFLRLHQDYGCLMQTGGSDQWGNLTAGTELVRRAAEVSAHAMATPLITNADGAKLGKSEGNAVWLEARMTSPYAFYQYWLNQADADVIDRLKVFTFLTREEIEELQRAVEQEPFRREAQKRLAWEVTVLVHGEEATRKAIAAAEALFGKGEISEIDEQTLQAIAAEVPSAELPAEEATAIGLLTAPGLVKTNSEARRTVKDGGAYVNNIKVQDVESPVPESSWLHGKYLVVRRGKKNLAVVTRTGA